MKLLALMTVLLIAGCAKSRTMPVEGVVTLDGQPLAGAAVQFVPQDQGRDATGETDASGRFAMSTFQPRDGVLPGSYKVVISPPTGSVDTVQYASADQAMAAAAKLPKKKPAKSFPQKYARPDQTPLTQEVPVQGEVRFELKR
jgi:hypothetical protein